MAALTVQKIKHVGITPTYAAASAGGDTFVNDGRTFLQVKNTGSQITMTITQIVKCSDGFLHSVAQVVTATTGDHMLGPFVPGEFNNSVGAAAISYTGVTGVTIGAFSLSETGR